jgi:hypothetical protein
LLDKPNHGITNPYDAPRGAVIVYDVTDRSEHGHVEIFDGTSFYSDYVSKNSRVTDKGKTTMEGRGRKVVGVWIKEGVE